MVVAEDHAELNNFISNAFESNGFRVLSAKDGTEALNLIQETIPDIVVTDLMMPSMNGEELVKAIKESDSLGHIPVIVLSAKGQVNSKVDMYSIGADNYLTKPFQLQELIAVGINTLKQRQRLQDKFIDEFLNNKTVNNTTDDTNTDISLSADMQQYIDYILNHLDDTELNVNTLGKEFNVGRNRLQREIKTATGLTPVEFIRSIRLNEAQKILKAKRIQYF